MILRGDLERLEKALLDLYSPRLTVENYAERSFLFFSHLIPSESAGLIIRDDALGKIDVAMEKILPGLQEVGEPFSKMGPKYPWFRADPETHGGQPHCRSDFCSDRQFRDLDIHSEIFRRWNHQHFMSMYVHSEQSRVVFFGFNRGRRDFSSKERALAALARPHLSTARHLALAMTAGKTKPVTPEMLARLGFTPRESDVLYWLSEGKSNAEIGVILHLQLSTVKGYLTAIYDKVGAGNRYAVILHVLQMAQQLDRNVLTFSNERTHVQAPYRLLPTKVG